MNSRCSILLTPDVYGTFVAGEAALVRRKLLRLAFSMVSGMMYRVGTDRGGPCIHPLKAVADGLLS